MLGKCLPRRITQVFGCTINLAYSCENARRSSLLLMFP
jgi:hypothetical protein